MKFHVQRYTADEWATVAESAHAATFSDFRTADENRIDFALLCVDAEKDKPVGYVTCSEVNKHVLLWKLGGSFPPIRASAHVLPAAEALLSWCSEGSWESVVVQVKNDNLPSLRLHMALGFRIFGVQCFEDELMVQLHLRLKGKGAWTPHFSRR